MLFRSTVSYSFLLVIVVCTPDGNVKAPGTTITSKKEYDTVICTPGMEGEEISLERNGEEIIKQTGYAFEEREIFKYLIEGGKARIVTKKTIDGERSFVENASTVKTGEAFTGILRLAVTEGEGIYGLGQHENGTYNYRNVKEYLFPQRHSLSAL